MQRIGQHSTARLDYSLESWLSERDTKEIFSSEYWNNESIEASKSFNVRKGFDSLESDSHFKNLLKTFREVSDECSLDWKNKSILSLGSGICWLESWFFKDKDFGFLNALDFSRHRIFDLAPITLAEYGIPADKVRLIHGSFLDLKLPDRSQDVVLMAQAFHHCDEPVRLLKEVDRVLKPEGLVIVLGEHYFSKTQILVKTFKHFAKYFLNYRNYRGAHSVFPQYKSLFPPCAVKGDHHYSITDYHYMFDRQGFAHQRFAWPHMGLQGFKLERKIRPI